MKFPNGKTSLGRPVLEISPRLGVGAFNGFYGFDIVLLN